MPTRILLIVLLPALAAAAPVVAGQERAATLAALLDEARARNPEIAAARARVDAAGARIRRAGALDDPMLGVGLMNVPARTLDLREEGMTMTTVELGQRLPAPGVRRAREAIAREARASALSEADAVERLTLARLKERFYDAWFAARAIEILAKTRATFGETAEVARGRYAAGASAQRDVLRAQVELARLEERLAVLRAERLAAIEELAALVDRRGLDLVPDDYPPAVHALALAPLPTGAFTAALDEGSVGGRLPPLAELQRLAEARPSLRSLAHEADAARQAARLAEAARFPDVELMLGYGFRWGHPDLLSAAVRLPLPVFAERRQRLAVVEARHELAAVDANVRAARNATRSEVARQHAMLVRRREQIRLLLDGVLPHARTGVEAASSAYRTGRGELPDVLDAHATLFTAELELARLFADFGRELAQLELAVGTDLLPEDGT